jgi:hypothetical protein
MIDNIDALLLIQKYIFFEENVGWGSQLTLPARAFIFDP